jgi:DnaK suppressor protein
MDELSEEQVGQLRAKLLAIVSEAEAMLESSADGAKPIDLDLPIGRLSRMDAIQQQQMTKANREQQRQRLVAVGLALKRMDDGSYGVCRRCEEPIPFARLEARPESPLCVDCLEELQAG